MYRQIDTGTWDDPWFAELDPDAKLLFLYLLTNRRSTAAGVFEITLRAMSFETGLDTKRINSALESISSRVEWWPEHQVVWVRNFLRHQAVSPKFYRSAWSEMREMPEDIRVSVAEIYPILTRPEPPPDKKEDIETLLIPYPKGIDTVSIPSRKTSTSTRTRTRPVKTSRLDNGADAPSSPDPKPSADTPYGLLQALCHEQGQEVSVFSERDKSRQLAVAKRLVESDMTAEKVVRITRWLKSQKWVTGGIDLFLIEKQLGKWRLAGQPETDQPSLTVHNGGAQSRTDDAFAQAARDLGIDWGEDDISTTPEAIDVPFRRAQ